MSAETIARAVACGLVFCGGLVMAGDEAPESDFLEYLGMWDETDEDWLMLEKTRIADDEEQSDDGEGDDTPENDDES